jgi:hypothetical protein
VQFERQLQPRTRGSQQPRAVGAVVAVLHIWQRQPVAAQAIRPVTGAQLATHFEIVVERLHLDKNDPNILHNEMTTTDNSLTRPWSAITDYHRNPNAVWREDACLANPYVTIGKQVYMLSADGRLMPLKKNQSPPDLGYFKSTTNGP